MGILRLLLHKSCPKVIIAVREIKSEMQLKVLPMPAARANVVNNHFQCVTALQWLGHSLVSGGRPGEDSMSR